MIFGVAVGGFRRAGSGALTIVHSTGKSYRLAQLGAIVSERTWGSTERKRYELMTLVSDNHHLLNFSMQALEA
jgi:hypothetical protein